MSAHGVAGPRDAAGRPARRQEQPVAPPPRPQPDLHVVVPVDASAARHRLRVRLAVVVASVFVIAVVFGLVGVHVVLAQNQFRLDRLNAQAQAQESTYQRLRLQVDQLESPQRIVAAAKGRLGMVQPAGVTYLTPSGPVPSGEPAAARPASANPSSAIPAPAPGPAEWAAVKPQLVTRP